MNHPPDLRIGNLEGHIPVALVIAERGIGLLHAPFCPMCAVGHVAHDVVMEYHLDLNWN